MVVVDARAHRAHPTAIPLRFGLHPAFVPRPNVRRQDHVLYAGRLTRDKGVGELLHAAARATEPWQLKFVGGGPLAQQLRRVAERLGIAERVRVHPVIGERERLARWYTSARVVVLPGARETFGLVGLEAAACGASVVTCSTAPSAALLRGAVRTYEPEDIDGLLAEIERRRARAAGRCGGRHARQAPFVRGRVRRRDTAARAAHGAAPASADDRQLSAARPSTSAALDATVPSA